LFHGIGCETVRVARNPEMRDDPWSRSASHYRVTLTKDGRRLRVHYSMGSAHRRPPDINDVLMTLAFEARDYENVAGDFAEWADQFDLDLDDPDTWRSFQAFGRQTEGLFHLLGPEVYAELLALSEGFFR
jgi:hypothetical protein